MAVSRETYVKLQEFVAILKRESEHHNLISVRSMANVWERHVIDSAQLVRYSRGPTASWVDIGSGAGFPGVVIACLVGGPIALIEPRRLRAQFLTLVVGELGLNATVIERKAQAARGQFDMITARAVAPVTTVLEISTHFSTGNSRWVLPKGHSAQLELVDARRTWHGSFHVEQSITNADSGIVIAENVEPRRY